MLLSRRALCLASLSSVLTPDRAEAAELPMLPLSIGVAELDGKPVATAAFVKLQLDEAKRLLSVHQVRVDRARIRPLPESAAALETADDRDALAAFVEPRVINVFIVGSLRDVDDPRRMRMGVRWRLRRNVRKDYVIVTASAMPTTLCHELGHFFGNGHSSVVNNVMSYRRDDPAKVAFDKQQGIVMRRVARRLLSSGRVVPIDKLPPPAQ